MSHVPFQIRLAVHAFAAVVFMAGYGYWHSITVPFFGAIPLGPFGIWLTMVWMVGLINAYNFMDGIDGLAAGHSVAAALGWVLLGWLSGRPLLMTLGVVLAASSLGFLAHNWHPARIFMGDVGSTLLGYSFAVLPIIASRADSRMALAGALLVWPAIFDTGFTVLRRLVHRQNVFVGHRTFLFHRLVDAGWSHASASLLYLPLPILGALLAYSWEWVTRFLHVLAIVVLIAACIGLWLVVRRGERKPAAYTMQPEEAMRIEA
jgi:UDP-N-acetylmuramyl pentapeptide phosphotransferase/UDP-N-acetylglucosamine-1-phosphate transferase